MPRQNLYVSSEESESNMSELESLSSDSDDDFPEQMNMPLVPSTTENSDHEFKETAESQEPEPMLRRSTRQRRRPDWYGNVVTLQTSDSELDD